MAFPAYGTAVPPLQDYQLNFNNQYTFGAGTALEIKSINGVEMPTVRSGDSGRPRAHGLFAGLDLLGGGEVTIEGDLRPDDVSFEHARAELAAATVPTGSEQYPLFMCLPGYGTLVTLARWRKRSIPLDVTYALGELAKVTLLLASTDPKWYSTPTQQLSVSPPGQIGGSTLPLTFPLTFREGSEAGVLSIENTGNIETCPILVVEGPCPDPSITLASAEGSPNLTFELSLNAGDRLVLDTDMETAMLYASGSTIGVTRRYALMSGSQWFTLPPGPSTLQFLTSDGDPSGLLTCQWASAQVL